MCCIAAYLFTFTFCCLVLPIICISLLLRLKHTQKERVSSCSQRYGRVTAAAEFQHSVVYYATDQWGTRLEARIHAEGGHSEHSL